MRRAVAVQFDGIIAYSFSVIIAVCKFCAQRVKFAITFWVGTLDTCIAIVVAISFSSNLTQTAAMTKVRFWNILKTT